MTFNRIKIYYLNGSHLLTKWLLSLLLVFSSGIVLAHPMPSSMVQVQLHTKTITLQIKLPITEFELAFGKELSHNPPVLVTANHEAIKNYIDQHVQIIDEKKVRWKKWIDNVSIDSATTNINGKFYEIAASITFEAPSQLANYEKINLLYDVIIHQVITHSALVSITHDFKNGISKNNEKQIGAISLNTQSNTIEPFVIVLQKGNWLTGFLSILKLGIQHIAEGTDHLLFLIVLLLTAPLIAVNKQWQGFGGNKYSFLRILKIVTAFTIGHSLTLIFGALRWLQLPQQPVEVLIAFSILVTAVHCVKPIFYKKEILIAASFGLIHGSAFSTVLSTLNLQGKELVLSILGFNMGIEIMQIAITAIALPILLYLSKQSFYIYIRIAGAIAAGVAAIFWIIERLSQ